jgi:hypothetical protein
MRRQLSLGIGLLLGALTLLLVWELAGVVGATPVRSGGPAVDRPMETASSLVLAPLHRNTTSNLSSVFAFTNTSGVAATYYLDFHWPNGEYVGSDSRHLAPGGRSTYDMDSDVPFGESFFVGEVQITGNQSLVGRILTPDYGLISGTVVADDGVTPVSLKNVNLYRASEDASYGNTYCMSDGHFYLGGLPDDGYLIWGEACYPWASQWYDGSTARGSADTIQISGASVAAITVTLQAGGRITGTVYAAGTVTPLESINVSAVGSGVETCSDALGRYVLEGLPFDQYRVQAGGGWNYCTASASPYLREYYSETLAHADATLLVLDSGSDQIVEIDFTLAEGRYIHLPLVLKLE